MTFTRTLALVSALCLLPAPLWAASAPSCGVDQLPSCSALSQSPSLNAAKDPKLGFGTQRDGGLIFNVVNFARRFNSTDTATRSALHKEQLPISTTNASDDSAKAKAQSVIDAAIELIKEGRSPLSPEQSALIARIQSMTIKIAENALTSSDSKKMILRDDSLCSPAGYANAGYTSESHTLWICPATMNATAKQFAQAISHEIGHVVSPCSERKVLYKVDESQTYPGPIAECDRSFLYDEDDNHGPTSDTIATLIAQKPASFVGYPNELNKKLAACGVISAVPNSSVASPRLFERSMRCLSKRYAAAHLFDREKYVNGQIRKGVSEQSAEAAFKSEMPGYCTRIAEEHFADSFSAKVMDHLASEHAWSKADFQIAALNMRSQACLNPNATETLVTDDYPLGSTRVAVLLTSPAAEKALGCSAPTEDVCALDLNFDDERSTSSGTNVKSSTGTGPSLAKKKTTTRSTK